MRPLSLVPRLQYHGIHFGIRFNIVEFHVSRCFKKHRDLYRPFQPRLSRHKGTGSRTISAVSVCRKLAVRVLSIILDFPYLIGSIVFINTFLYKKVCKTNEYNWELKNGKNEKLIFHVIIFGCQAWLLTMCFMDSMVSFYWYTVPGCIIHFLFTMLKRMFLLLEA